MKTKDFYVTLPELNRAFTKVRNELSAMGVLDEGSPLDEVGCHLEYLPHDLNCINAFFTAQGYCPVQGDIYIPHLIASPLWGEKRNVVNVLRHEFGHALADRYPECFTGIFAKAFGREYDDRPAVEEDEYDWADKYVTAYASTESREDWAETFELFMKHKGKLPARFARKPVIRRKWNTVRAIVRKVAQTV